jgi:hypothetical protein
MAAEVFATGRAAGAPPPLTPPHKGEGVLGAGASESPSPLWGSGGRARPVARPGRRGGRPVGRLSRTIPLTASFDPYQRRADRDDVADLGPEPGNLALDG